MSNASTTNERHVDVSASAKPNHLHLEFFDESVFRFVLEWEDMTIHKIGTQIGAGAALGIVICDWCTDGTVPPNAQHIEGL